MGPLGEDEWREINLRLLAQERLSSQGVLAFNRAQVAAELRSVWALRLRSLE